MSSLFPQVSLRRSTRNNTVSADTESVRPVSRSFALARRKTRPPPLQIIPELSENVLDIDIFSTLSPATARPTQSFPQRPESDTSRITLSAYTFSIDHALLMFGDEAPRSPSLSTSSSTSGSTSSDGVPVTPLTSGDEDEYDRMLPTPRLCPQRISIRPLCVIKTRTLVCQEDEDMHEHFEKDGYEASPLPATAEQPESPTEVEEVTEATEEAEQDFYAHEFEDFISLFPVVPSPTYSARRDSLTLVVEALPTVINVPEPKTRGRSRHSKPLPLLPPPTPPLSSFPSTSTLPLVRTTAQKSIVRRKRNIPSRPSGRLPSPPSKSRQIPRGAIPQDVEDCVFHEETFDIAIKQIHSTEEDASVYSSPSFTHTTSDSIHPLAPAVPETSISGMYSEVKLPRSSIDSDAPRSSVDSALSFVSSSSSNAPISSYSFPESPSLEGPDFESTQRLRSRWSSSTLASLAVESPRTPTLLSPLKSVLGPRARWALLPPQKLPPQTTSVHLTPPMLSKNKQSSPTTTSPLRTLGKRLRRRKSRSSTSSTGASSSECDNPDGSPSGLRKEPTPATMFLRAT